MNYQNALIIPLTGIEKPFIGAVQSLQFIQPDGQKRYLSGGKKAGGFYPIQWIDDAPIVICEGFATGATLAEHYTPFSSVICAFDSGNLKAIAKAFRSQHPTAQIIIAGDNDHQTERNTGTNIGQQKAIVAAKAVNGIVSIPQFAPNEAGSDWNDRYLIDNAGGAK
jgi:putative DNA primase/helicase